MDLVVDSVDLAERLAVFWGLEASAEAMEAWEAIHKALELAALVDNNSVDNLEDNQASSKDLDNRGYFTIRRATTAIIIKTSSDSKKHNRTIISRLLFSALLNMCVQFDGNYCNYCFLCVERIN